MASLAHLRKEYQKLAFNKEDASENAIEQFERWWQDALKSEIDEVNAMTLATASADGLPSARIILLKGYSEKGFQFYTNYESFKGKQLRKTRGPVWFSSGKNLNDRYALQVLWKN